MGVEEEKVKMVLEDGALDEVESEIGKAAIPLGLAEPLLHLAVMRLGLAEGYSGLAEPFRVLA